MKLNNLYREIVKKGIEVDVRSQPDAIGHGNILGEDSDACVGGGGVACVMKRLADLLSKGGVRNGQ